jgi:tetratricopeptide (TPR) repeat protein
METIRQLIHEGQVAEAIRQLDALIADGGAPDEAFYLRGNAYRKSGNWRQALNNYLSAMELNPESPAHEAYRMAMDILEFYNKDMFNQ